MKIFGLLESMNLQVMGVMNYRLPVTDADLYKLLETSDKNLSVGIEMSSDKKVLKFPKSPLRFEVQAPHLKLLDFFKSRGQKVYFLENEAYFAEIAKSGPRLVELKKEIEHCESREQYVAKNKEFTKLNLEVQYKMLVGKEEHILENIIKNKPDLVFLGDAHAGRFYRRKDELKTKGVDIEEYFREKAIRIPGYEEVMNAMRCSDELMDTEDYLGDIEATIEKVSTVEDAHNDSHSMQLERQYKALKEQRVTDGNPNFIGSWSLTQGLDDYFDNYIGLFEVFVKNSRPVHDGESVEIEGTIEDCLGSADFSGFMSKNRIVFTKQYAAPGAIAGTSEFGAARSPIKYIGDRKDDGTFEGDYNGRDCGNGYFKLKELLPVKI